MEHFILFECDGAVGICDSSQENLYVLDLQHGFVEKIGDVWEVFGSYDNLTWNGEFKGLLFDGLEDNGFYITYTSKEGNITAYNSDIEHYIFAKIEGGAKDE